MDMLICLIFNYYFFKNISTLNFTNKKKHRPKKHLNFNESVITDTHIGLNLKKINTCLKSLNFPSAGITGFLNFLPESVQDHALFNGNIVWQGECQ